MQFERLSEMHELGRFEKHLTVDCFQEYCETTYRVSGYMYLFLFLKRVRQLAI